MPNDHRLLQRVVRRHLGEPTKPEAVVEDAVIRQCELLDVMLRCAAELDDLRHVALAAIDGAGDDPHRVLARVAGRFEERDRRGADDHELRLRDAAAQVRSLLTRIHRDNTLDMADVVRALEAIVEAAGVTE
jgi:hypothetical protein